MGKKQTIIPTVTNINNDVIYNRKMMQQAYSTFSFQQRPTVLLTLTVKEPKGNHGNWLVPDSALIQKANLLIHWINVELFGRKYQKKNKGLTGFGSIEKQANHQPHIHLAITNFIPPKLFLKLKQALFDKVQKISLFESKGINVQQIKGDDADHWRVGSYIAKDGRMLTLSPDGIA